MLCYKEQAAGRNGPRQRTDMDKILESSLLYDFYGPLLTPHQRKIFEDVRFGDLSLSEAAEEYGVSRQGIHDQLRRIDSLLAGYEEKLGLVARFTAASGILTDMKKILVRLGSSVPDDLREDVGSIARLTDELEELN